MFNTENRNQKANFNRITELRNAGYSYETIASAFSDKGLEVTPIQLKNYHELATTFCEKQYLSKAEVKSFSEISTDTLFA